MLYPHFADTMTRRPRNPRDGGSSDDETQSAEEQQLAQENDTLRAQIAHLQAATPAKRSKTGISAQMKKIIENCVKDKLWRTQKFVTSQAQLTAFTTKVWENLDIADAYRNVLTPETWQETHRNMCSTALNTQRTYVVGRLREAAKDYMAVNGIDKLPTYGQIESLATRQIRTPEMKKLFIWYLDILVRRASGNKYDYSVNKRCFAGPSTCTFANHHTKLHIPPSTEAFIVLAWDCYRAKWIAQKEFQDANPGKELPKPRHLNGKLENPADSKYLGKYTNIDSGSTIMGGWSHAGMLKFDTLTKQVKAARLTPECAALEAEALPGVRANNKVNYATLEELEQSKRRTPVSGVVPPAEIEFDEEE